MPTIESTRPERASKPIAQDPEQRRFVRRVLIVLGLASLFIVVLITLGLAWTAMLTLFGGVLIGVLFDGVATKVSAWTRVPRGVVLVALLLAMLGAVIGGAFWLGPAIAERASGAQEAFVQTWAEIASWLEAREWGRRALAELDELSLSTLVSGKFGGMLGTTVGSLASLGLMFVFGAYFAFDPEIYMDGFGHLFPDQHRPRVREVTQSIGRALRAWLVGRFTMMAVVGAGTALGLWLIGLPLAIPLGVLAGLLAFVPNLGPILAAVPGVVIGLTVDWQTAMYAMGVYLGVQFIEGYALTPLIQMRVVSMPPALLIGFQLLMGLSAGIIGLFMATPLLVTIVVLIQAVYLRDVLDEDIALIGGGDGDDDEPERSDQLELDLQ